MRVLPTKLEHPWEIAFDPDGYLWITERTGKRVTRVNPGEPIPYFKTTNRYRDLAISADGRTFYIITDNDNYTQDPSGMPTQKLENPGTILEFTYAGDA